MTPTEYRALTPADASKPIRELSASDITQTTLTLLKLRRICAWRQNNLTVRRRKGIVKKGVVDILGYALYTPAVFVACEVKKIGDTLSDEQTKFLLDLHNAGGIALIATQIGNEVRIIDFNEYVKK